MADYTQIKAIRDALVYFKQQSDKQMTAYADYYTQKTYYLSSVADRIYVSPEGSIALEGLASQLMFFKDFQEKVWF